LAGLLAAASLFLGSSRALPAATQEAAPDIEELAEISITAPEPRYVAPTRRDGIGRIWAPVMINGKGPFRLVLDTGASHSAIIDAVADALGIDVANAPRVRLRGVTGTAVVPMVPAQWLTIGDLELRDVRLPIVVNALGGAQGVLGTNGFEDKRIVIDFRNDLILINRSHSQRAAAGMITVPFVIEQGLLVVTAYVGGIRTRAIIDTGGQGSIGNLALRDQLLSQRRQQGATADVITGATDDSQTGQGYPAPEIQFEDISVRGSHITFGDMSIFEHWGMADQPAILIAMDTLGLFDTLIIDYRRRELQIRLRQKDRL